MPSIAVVGASRDRSKFGNKCVRAYAARGWTVHPVNPHETTIEGLAVAPSLAALPGPVERIAFYVPPATGVALLDDVKAFVAERGEAELWINPGAESPALRARAAALGLSPVEDCAIVAIGESPARYGG